MLFPLAWLVVENFSLDLNANYFLYSLAIGGVGCNVDELEKSDKAKTEVLHFVSSILTSCILVSTMFGRLGIDWPWHDPLKKEALLWRSSKHLESGSFDQRCNVNLIIRRVTRLKSTFCTWSLQYNIMHCDINNVRSAHRQSTVMWSVEGRSSYSVLFQISWIRELWSEV